MPAGLEFCLLGPLLVRRDGVTVPLPEGKQRVLLAALLLRTGRVVAADELAELLWAPTAPPPSAPVTVRNYVKRLRRALGPAGQDRIVTRPGGYLIRVEPGELDVWVLEQALAAVSAASWQDAARHAAAALRLWRGDPLCGVESPMLTAAEVSRLTELRLQAYELRIEADLQLGLHAAVVTDLRQLTAANPLRENLHAQLMLAFYRCGRRAEALEAYAQSRNVLIEEAGSEPGPVLQALHQQILRDDPALARPSAEPRADRARGPAAASPRQLPTDVRCFTGRDAELDALWGMLSDTSAAGPVVISAIAGTAGVGKPASEV